MGVMQVLFLAVTKPQHTSNSHCSLDRNNLTQLFTFILVLPITSCSKITHASFGTSIRALVCTLIIADPICIQVFLC